MRKATPIIEMEESVLRAASMSVVALQRAVSLVPDWVAKGILPGACLLIGRANQLVFEGYWGIADKQLGIPASVETLWSIASITKPITATVVMACVDQGLFGLDEPIARLLPEFTMGRDPTGLRNKLTFRHFLTHTSGLAGFSRDNLALRQRHAPLEEFITSCLREEVFFPPGQYHLYSSVGYGLLAEAVGRAVLAAGPMAQGQPTQEAFHSLAIDLVMSLGSADATFKPDKAQRVRIARVESTGQEGRDWEMANSEYYRSLGLPWGGLFATGRTLLSFCQAFMPHAKHSSSPPVSRIARGEMTRKQVDAPDAPATLAPDQRDVAWDPQREPRSHVPWGLGWEVKGDQPSDYMGDYAHPLSFGHFGSTGTVAWVDPEEELAVVLLSNRAWMSGWAVTERRVARVSNGIMAALL